jgi:Polyketide cyclase / dehydrase and lipid transport
VKDKIKEKLPGGGGRKSAAKKFSNIIDSFDVGVPVRVAYNQWTQFNQWSEFMKKLEFAEAKDDEGKVQFRAKIFVLHRSWESTIIDMVPDEHIVWQSTGQKGYLNGAVTFSELTPNLTRLSLAVEYHPAGFWENLINIWRSVGSRVRLETKLYIHHVMTSTQLEPDAVQGWRAEIHDKEVVRTHDEVVEQERQEQEERDRQEQEDQDERDGEDRDGDGEAPQGDDEYDDEDRTDSQDDEDESDEDEFYDEDEDEEDEDEDAYDEDQPDEDQEPYDEDESDQDESDEEERTPAGAGRNGGR